jgi:hypothetical protein
MDDAWNVMTRSVCMAWISANNKWFTMGGTTTHNSWKVTASSMKPDEKTTT